MAEDETSPLGVLLNDLFDRGVNGITSARSLAVKLAELKGTTLEGERTSIRRHIRTGQAEEESLVWYATAFGIDRSAFPAATVRGGATSVKELKEQMRRDAERITAFLGPLPAEGIEPGATLPGRLRLLEEMIERQGEEMTSALYELAAEVRALGHGRDGKDPPARQAQVDR